MATLWTERTIEESGQDLEEKVEKVREMAGNIVSDLRIVGDSIATSAQGWWSQIQEEEWLGTVETLETIGDNIVRLGRRMKDVDKAVEEMKDQGVI